MAKKCDVELTDCLLVEPDESRVLRLLFLKPKLPGVTPDRTILHTPMQSQSVDGVFTGLRLTAIISQ